MGQSENAAFLMKTVLQVAVPMWLDRLAVMTDEERGMVATKWAHDAADVVASQGDVLQFGGKPGEAAAAFNALARGLAALSTAPGGVRFLGTIWCATHAVWGYPADDDEIVCRSCLADGGGVVIRDSDHPLHPPRRRILDTLTPDGRYL
jgi:hypothetical protein